MPARPQPTIAKSARYVSDVAFSHTLTEDRRELTILFDNFAVESGRDPVATRLLSLSFALADVVEGTRARLSLRGAADFAAGAGTLLLRAFGSTRLLEPPPGDFVQTFALGIPAGANLDLTIVLIAERGGDRRGIASVTLDSLEVVLATPAKPEKATRRAR